MLGKAEKSAKEEMTPAEKENVGENYREDSLRTAQARAWKALEATAAQLKPGDTEKDALAILKSVLKTEGVEKIWHPPQIRFGPNTIQPFGKPGVSDVRLRENDLFFLDIGPVFEGHEGDVGTTFTIGDDPRFKKIASDAKAVFNDVRDEWARTGKNGEALYAFAAQRAEEKGWKLSLNGASGHRVSDFPHAIHYRGKLKTFAATPTANRWILEIHLVDPDGQFGAFHEDLL